MMNRLIIVIFTAKNMMKNINKKKKISLHNISMSTSRQCRSRLLKPETKEAILEVNKYNCHNLRENIHKETMNSARKTSLY